MDYCFSCGKLRHLEQLGECVKCGVTQCGLGECTGSCLCEYDVEIVEILEEKVTPIRKIMRRAVMEGVVAAGLVISVLPPIG